MKSPEIKTPNAPVLIVDDRLENLHAFEHTLRDAGFETLAFDSGEKVLAYLLQGGAAALILMDVQMPQMNGFEVAQMIRTDQAQVQVPILFITATECADEFVSYGYSVGAYDYLTKPINSELLVNKVRTFHTLYRQQQTLQQLNRELALQKAYAEGLVHAMSEALVVVDSDHCMVDCNPAFVALCNSTHSALCGQRIDTVLRPKPGADADIGASIARMQAEQAEQAEQTEQEWDLQQGDGTLIPVITSGAALQRSGQSGQDGQSDSRRVLVVLQDLRERKRRAAQEQYSAYSAGVAEMSAHIIHNIGNAIQGVQDGLLQTQQAVTDIEQFSGGFDQLLQQRNKNADDRATTQHLQQVVEQLPQRLTEILPQQPLQRAMAGVQHIADVVRTRQLTAAGETTIESTAFLLSQLLDDLLLMNHNELERLQIEVTVVLDPQLHEVTLPRNPLLQSLFNLLKNSREAIERQLQRGEMEPGAGRIEITARAVEASQQSQLQLVIADNGNGIEPEALPQLLRFGYSTRSSSGIGLHSVGNFAEQLGGALTIDSDGAGQGARVTLRLPLAAEQALRGVA